MIVNGFLIVLAALLESVLLANNPVFGTVPAISFLAVVWLGRRAQKSEDVIIYGAIAGCALDTLRPAYSPWLLVSGLLVGIITWLWFHSVGLRNRLTQRFSESVLVPLLFACVVYNVVMVVTFGIQISATHSLLMISLQFGLLLTLAAIGWVVEGRMAQS